MDNSPDIKLIHEPLKYSGFLDHVEFIEVTPIIEREYTTAKIKDILHASNAEQQIRDLTVIISEGRLLLRGTTRSPWRRGVEEIYRFCGKAKR